MKPSRAAVAVLMMFLSTAAFAQRMHVVHPPDMTMPGNFVMGPNMPAALGPCMMLLNLTDTQRTQIQAILKAAQPTFDTLAARLEADHAALVALAGATSPDACAIGRAYLQEQTDVKALQAQADLVRGQITALLTPDQKARLEGCIDALGGMMMHP